MNPASPRTPISLRLGSLFPRVPADTSDSESDSSMLTTRSASAQATRSISSTRATKRRSLPVHLPSFFPMGPAPVVRWSDSGSNSPSDSTPPSPSLSSLNEALNEDILPAALHQAHLPPSFYASRTLSHPPPFLDNLTRSTLPVASLSPGRGPNAPQSILHNDREPSSPTAQLISQQSAGLKSVDTLRSVRDRRIHTTVSRDSPSPSRPTSWWLFQGDNKQNVDTLLDEEDRADSVNDEQTRLRKKCESLRLGVAVLH